VNYKEWESGVPEMIVGDALWRVQAYRLALFAADIGWEDVTRLNRDRRTRRLSDQLYRSLGSVSANIAEGYSRSSGKDRARFYEYALGSARESRDWYYKARHVLDGEVIEHRLTLQTQIIRLLLKMVPDQRQHTLREEDTPYEINT
jgi:four helix bundle protein